MRSNFCFFVKCKCISLYLLQYCNNCLILLLLLLFLTFSAMVANPKKKLLYTVANPARGLLNRGKKEKRKSLAAPSPPPPARAARSEKINK